MTLLFALILAVGVAAFWYDSLGARECALKAGRAACSQNGLQLLDQTVALAGLRLARNRSGRLRLNRRYRFEFSLDGYDRCDGYILLLGHWPQAVHLEHPDGLVIIEGNRPGRPTSG